MRHEDDLKKIYFDAYFKVSLAKSNGKKGLRTRHGVALRAVWDAAIASVTPSVGAAVGATSAELFEALGMSKDDAQREGTRVYSIAAGGPQLVKPATSEGIT